MNDQKVDIYLHISNETKEFIYSHSHELFGYIVEQYKVIHIRKSYYNSIIPSISDPNFYTKFEQLKWIYCTIAKKCFQSTIQALLSCLQPISIQDVQLNQQLLSWVVGDLILSILQSSQSNTKGLNRQCLHLTDDLSSTLLEECIKVFKATDKLQITHRHRLSIFKFKASHMEKEFNTDRMLQYNVNFMWKCIVKEIANSCFYIVKQKLQIEICQSLSTSKTKQRKMHILRHFSLIQLGLVAINDLQELSSKLDMFVAWYRMLQPMFHKPYTYCQRNEAITLAGTILSRELVLLASQNRLDIVYSMSSHSQWIDSIRAIHMDAVKLCNKKKLAQSAWHLRVASLSASPNKMYEECWKKDIYALLKLQQKLQKENGPFIETVDLIMSEFRVLTTLEFISSSLSNIVYRHKLCRIPKESECKAVISSIQTCCFPKVHSNNARSIRWVDTILLPALVNISISIAAFDMEYCIYSHLRRLLVNPDNLADENKLIGLESLIALCQITVEGGRQYRNLLAPHSSSLQALHARDYVLGNGIEFTLMIQHIIDKVEFWNYAKELGELIGHVLIECNAACGNDLLGDKSTVSTVSFGHFPSLPSKRKNRESRLLENYPQNSVTYLVSEMFNEYEYSAAMGLQIFASSILCHQYFYSSMELTNDQKIIILTRAAIHKEKWIRINATWTLESVLTREKYQAFGIFQHVLDNVYRKSLPKSNESTASMTQGLSSNSERDQIDTEALKELLHLLSNLVKHSLNIVKDRTSQIWKSLIDMQESLTQIEATCIYLLCREDLETTTLCTSIMENIHELRQPMPTESFETEQSTSIVDIISSLEIDVKDRLFGFHAPDLVQKLENKPLGFFRQLLMEKKEGNIDIKNSNSSLPKVKGETGSCLSQIAHSFRWSTFLSMLYSRVIVMVPDIAIYLWPTVSDIVIKYNPTILSDSVSITTSISSTLFSKNSMSHNFTMLENHLWRNLAIMAASIAFHTAIHNSKLRDYSNDACSDPQPLFGRKSSIYVSSTASSRTSIISSTAITTLIKRLATFLRSSCFEHQTSAIMALGCINPYAGFILVDVLVMYEKDAFLNIDMCLSDENLYKYQTKQQSVFENQAIMKLRLLFALGRTYKLLLDSLWRWACFHDSLKELAGVYDYSVSTETLEIIINAASGFLMRLTSPLEQISATAVDHCDRHVYNVTSSLFFMLKQDFCASVQSICMLDSMLNNLKSNENQDVSSKCGSGEDGGNKSYLHVDCNRWDELTKLRWLRLSFLWSSFAQTPYLPTCYQETFNQWINKLKELQGDFEATFFKPSSSSQCTWMETWNILNERVGHALLPWHWLASDSILSDSDEATDMSCMRACQDYFLSQYAFSLILKLVGTLRDCKALVIQDFKYNSSVMEVSRCAINCCLEVIDTVFSVEALKVTPHITTLQSFALRSLQCLMLPSSDAFEESMNFLNLCILKCLFGDNKGAGYNRSRNYFFSLHGVMENIIPFLHTYDKPSIAFNSLLEDANDRSSQDNTVFNIHPIINLIRVIILHAGLNARNCLHCLPSQFVSVLVKNKPHLEAHIYGDISCAQEAKEIYTSVEGKATRSCKISIAQTTEMTKYNQLIISHALCQLYPKCSYAILLTVLNSLSNTALQIKQSMLHALLPWMSNIELVDVLKYLQFTTDQFDLNSIYLRPTKQLCDELVISINMLHSINLLQQLFNLTLCTAVECGTQLEELWFTLAFSDQYPSNLPYVCSFICEMAMRKVNITICKLVIWWLSKVSKKHAASTFLHVVQTISSTEDLRHTRDSEISNVEQKEPGYMLRRSMKYHRPFDKHVCLIFLMCDNFSNYVSARRIPQYFMRSLQHNEAPYHIHWEIPHTMALIHSIFLVFFALNSNNVQVSDGGCMDLTENERNRIAADFLGRDGSKSLPNRSHVTFDLMDSDLANTEGENITEQSNLELWEACFKLWKHVQGCLFDSQNISRLNTHITSCMSHLGCNSAKNDIDIYQRGIRQPKSDFNTLLEELSTALSDAEVNAWKTVCSEEFDSFLLSPIPEGSTNTTNLGQELMCLHFAVLVYGTLTTIYDGVMFLKLVDILQRAINHFDTGSVTVVKLIISCLGTLKVMLEKMPSLELGSHLHILWVTLALLNHSATIIPEGHILRMLVSVLEKPGFEDENCTIHSILESQRPGNWSMSECSILRAAIKNLIAGSWEDTLLRLHIVQESIALPASVIMVTNEERSIIETAVLLPFIHTHIHKVYAVNSQNQSATSQFEVIILQDCEHVCNKLAVMWDHLSPIECSNNQFSNINNENDYLKPETGFADQIKISLLWLAKLAEMGQKAGQCPLTDIEDSDTDSHSDPRQLAKIHICKIAENIAIGLINSELSVATWNLMVDIIIDTFLNCTPHRCEEIQAISTISSHKNPAIWEAELRLFDVESLKRLVITNALVFTEQLVTYLEANNYKWELSSTTALLLLDIVKSCKVSCKQCQTAWTLLRYGAQTARLPSRNQDQPINAHAVNNTENSLQFNSTTPSTMSDLLSDGDACSNSDVDNCCPEYNLDNDDTHSNKQLAQSPLSSQGIHSPKSSKANQECQSASTSAK